jgi:hypothetical protein
MQNWERLNKAEIEALGFAPKSKSAVIKTLMKRLRTDAAGVKTVSLGFSCLCTRPITSS